MLVISYCYVVILKLMILQKICLFFTAVTLVCLTYLS
jgi:hypothetical protein